MNDFAAKKALLVMFICRHCPFVKHVESELAQIGIDYESKDVGIVAISANDPAESSDDAPESLKEMAAQLGFRFPYLYDESQGTAKAYSAACTPDFFLFDRSRKLVYRGQLDDSRPDSGKPVTGKDLRAAMDAVLADQPVNPGSASQHRLQHQVEKWKRTFVFQFVAKVVNSLTFEWRSL